jgi:hypothetical protein
MKIAITTELAPAMARTERDALSPGFDALAAAVVRSSLPDKVRLQMLFDKGVVLPVEMGVEAGLGLSGGLMPEFH